ncbi:hypothetical protein ACOSP7_017864 [Xanthoceras sorbifolium]
MKLGESVSEYFSRTMAIANKMRIHREKLVDVTIVEKILRSMMAKFNYIYGHYRSECRVNLNKNRGEHGERSNFAEKEEEKVFLLMMCHTKEKTHQNLWYLDTGCNNHMCGDKNAFSDLDESFRNTVKFGDKSTVSVMGRGRVTL